MDPTAPKDNPTPPASPAQRGEPSSPAPTPPPAPNPPASPPLPPVSPDASLGGPPNDPIQPGGFVVSDDTDKVFRQPPPKINLAGPASPAQRGEPLTPDSPPPASSTPTSPLSPPLTAAKMQQPNPAPYEPPPGEAQAQSGSPSKIDKLRLLTIGLGALFVIILAAALGWFFFIGRPSQEAANVQIEETDVEEPSPPPKNKTGGFAILPTPSEATPEATGAAQ